MNKLLTPTKEQCDDMLSNIEEYKASIEYQTLKSLFEKLDGMLSVDASVIILTEIEKAHFKLDAYKGVKNGN